MKTLKLLLTLFVAGLFFNACTTHNTFDNQPTLEDVVSGYHLWYVDIHKTTGTGSIPYMSRAFTLSFLNGILYANNNIVDIGFTGNGLGIEVGNYNTFNGLLETNHRLDGANDFEVTILSNNEIRLYNSRQNVSYYLVGYQINNFDYDKLFYENIEYFLQEYAAWEKTTTTGGVPNAFDAENYLRFIPENITTFESSKDAFGTQIGSIIWDYIGGYEIFDVAGFNNVKILTLIYDGGDIEEFELTVINDGKIELYSLDTETTYDFLGRGFIPYLKGENLKMETKNLVRNNNRERTKVKRKTKERRHLN